MFLLKRQLYFTTTSHCESPMAHWNIFLSNKNGVFADVLSAPLQMNHEYDELVFGVVFSVCHLSGFSMHANVDMCNNIDSKRKITYYSR